MKRWLRRIRGAVLMGLTWAVVWAPVGVLIGMVVDPDGSMDEPWVAVGAYPGFLGGVVFSTVLGIVARRRRLDELSLPRVAAWGAVAGMLVGALPFAVGTATSALPLWLLGGVVVGSITLLSAASAAGSLALARRADAGADADALTAAPDGELPPSALGSRLSAPAVEGTARREARPPEAEGLLTPH